MHDRTASDLSRETASRRVQVPAPAKLNLILRVGPRRNDGLHEICSLFATLELADLLEVSAAPTASSADVVECPGVSGDNLVEVALREFRATVGSGAPPPLRVSVAKEIPIAAGLGGGSADAAAALRVVNRLSAEPLDAPALEALAARIGADVPSQLSPSHAFVSGAGELVEPVSLPAIEVLLVPSRVGLATAAVYAEADRLGLTRATLDPAAVRTASQLPLHELADRVENDLQPAALSLRPELAEGLGELRALGALAAAVTGSGPTLFGIFETRSAAQAAAGRIPGAIVTRLSSGALRNN
jgi:4-diphosphocytidyl-2-C-methyl-D-erythritol kinase